MKTKIIIIFILFSTKSFCDLGGSASIATPEIYNNYNILITDIGLSYDYNVYDLTLTPFTNINTWMAHKENSFFNYPFRDIYTLGIIANYKNFTLSIDHYCSHSVYSSKVWEWNKNYIDDDVYIMSLSVLSKAMFQYSYINNNFNIDLYIAKIIDNKDYYFSSDISYKTSYYKIGVAASYWSGISEKERSQFKIYTKFEYNNTFIELSFTDNSREIKQIFDNNHLYDEYTLDKTCYMIKIGYKI